MTHPKIIFLDVDGVICLPSGNFERFDNNALWNLEHIINFTGAKIVVSSSWRCGDLQLTKNSLMQAGLTQALSDHIIGETIRGYHHTCEKSYLKVVRGNEIGTWIDRNLKCPWHENPEMTDQYREFKEDGSFKSMRLNKLDKDYSYVILDDNQDMLFCQRNHFICTNGTVGLTLLDARKAIEILNKIDNAKDN